MSAKKTFAQSFLRTQMLEPNQKRRKIVQGLEVQFDILNANIIEFTFRISRERWCGSRLQPCSPSVTDPARCCRLEIRIVGFLGTPVAGDVALTAAHGMLPLGNRRQAALGPGGEGRRVVPRDLRDRMIGVPRFCFGSRAVDVGPVGAVNPAPPFYVDDALRVRDAVWDVRPEDEGSAESFGFGDVAGSIHEGGELGVGDRRGRDTKGTESSERRISSPSFGMRGEDVPRTGRAAAGISTVSSTGGSVQIWTEVGPCATLASPLERGTPAFRLGFRHGTVDQPTAWPRHWPEKRSDAWHRGCVLCFRYGTRASAATGSA